MRKSIIASVIAAVALAAAVADPAGVQRTGLLASSTHGLTLSLGPWQGFTVPDLGAIQGVSVIGDALYIYGGAETGVIAEFSLEAARRGRLVPTGRRLALTASGADALPHPTGLTSLDGETAIMGDTVRGVGTIHFIDWQKAWAQGTLDGAILHTVRDDEAVNGTRPHFVRHGGRWLIATSDYGNAGNAVRLYDPDKLRRASRTGERGVLVASLPCGPYVQNVHWVEDLGTLVLIQNREPGLLYRFGLASLAGIEQGADLRDVPAIDLDSPTDELEGFATLGGGMCIMVSAMREHNVWIGPIGIR